MFTFLISFKKRTDSENKHHIEALAQSPEYRVPKRKGKGKKKEESGTSRMKQTITHN